MRTFPSPAHRFAASVAVVALLGAGCSSDPPAANPPAAAGPTTGSSATPAPTAAIPTPTTSAPADAAGPVTPAVKLSLRPVPVSVPAALRQAPFNQARRLSVPAGWRISVFARVPKARFMAVTPDGRVLVSQPSTGKVLLVERGPGGVGRVSTYLSGLAQPHDVVHATLGGRQWVYVAESNRVRRYPYRASDRTAQPAQTVVDGLPNASTPELKGAYAHALKNIAVGPDHKLYVSIGSSCNVCVSDTKSDPQRGAIYRYGLPGGNRELFAAGLRNAEGLAFVPDTGLLWVVVNNRDNIAFPDHRDWDNDGADDFGKVIPAYVDNHPPEEFARVIKGEFYGWPYCNPNPDRTLGMRDLPFDRDAQTNADGQVDCAKAHRIEQGIPAHSAPLGLTFLQRTNAPTLIRGGAVVAYHGSWNRTQPAGYKVVWFYWNYGPDRPAAEQDLVSGFVDDAGKIWGRPVDVAVDRDGSLLVSDDQSGTIYRLSDG